MSAATAAILMIMLMLLMGALAVIGPATPVRLGLRATPLPAAQDHEEKTGEQDKSEKNEQFHDVFRFG